MLRKLFALFTLILIGVTGLPCPSLAQDVCDISSAPVVRIVSHTP